MNVCVVCKTPADKKCSLCHSVFYCSRVHQKEDWKRHKGICIAYKIEENPDLGRYLIASRRIGTGEEILRERPLISGPVQVTPPVCLGCYTILSELGSIECPKCGWPMCSIECAKSPQHYPECKITQNRGAKVKIQTFQLPHPSYESLMVLRCLAMKKDKPKIWERLNSLESHCQERKGTEKYERDRRAIAEFIHRFYKFEDFTAEEILRVSGIININAHEVPISGHDFVSIYDVASYLEHNCQANCSKSFSSSGDLVIRAAWPIEPGEHLSICYADPLWGTISRRQYLMETKYFRCNCKRCQDPTELDTHFSSLRCQNGDCKGAVIPIDPLQCQQTQDWVCNICKSLSKTEEISLLISQASEQITSIDKSNLQDCKRFLKTWETIFHSNHFLLTEIKLEITQILDSNVSGLSEENLNLKLKYCSQLNKLVSKLVPAENRCRGVLLFGLHAALAEHIRRRSSQGNMDQEDFKNGLLECKEILSEAYKLLKHEPEILPEGQIAIQAKTNLKELEKVLHTIHIRMGNSIP